MTPPPVRIRTRPAPAAPAVPTRTRTRPTAPAPDAAAPTGQLYGYARVSTADQDLSIQEAALRAAGCDPIRSEKRSGTSTEGRTQLRDMIDFARRGDTIVVTKIDRLARSIADLSSIVRELEAKGVALRALDQPVDTGTAAGKAFLGMLGVFAEFETNLRRERQLDGIAAAKKAGVYKGRPASINADAVRALADEGVGGSEIARRLGIGRASVYRLLGNTKPTA